MILRTGGRPTLLTAVGVQVLSGWLWVLDRATHRLTLVQVLHEVVGAWPCATPFLLEGVIADSES